MDSAENYPVAMPQIQPADVSQRTFLYENGNQNEECCSSAAMCQPPIYVSSAYGDPKNVTIVNPVASNEDTLKEVAECVSEVYVYKKLKSISVISIILIIFSVFSISVPTVGGVMYSNRSYSYGINLKDTAYELGSWAFSVPIVSLVFILLQLIKNSIYSKTLKYIHTKYRNSAVRFLYVKKDKIRGHLRTSFASDILVIIFFIGNFIASLVISLIVLGQVEWSASCISNGYSYYYYNNYFIDNCSGVVPSMLYAVSAGFMIWCVSSIISVYLASETISSRKYFKNLFIPKVKNDDEEPFCRILNIAKIFSKL